MKLNTNMVKRWFKGLLKSWTARFNAAMGTIGFMLPEILDYLQYNLPQVADKIPPNIYPYLAAFVALVNIYLRARTDKPLSKR